VIADVLVIVNVNVFVWELNSQTTVAVEACPEFTPEIVIVSALPVVAAKLKITSEKIIWIRDILTLLVPLRSKGATPIVYGKSLVMI